MFKSQNFCHIASNNRNNVKAGMFIYRTTDDLATVTANGYFNDRIIDLNLHDIIVHEQIDNADPTKVKQNFLCVVQKTLTNVNTKIMDTDEVDGADTDLDNLSDTGKANISAKGTYDPNETYGAGTVGAAIQSKADAATSANTDLSNLTSTGANIGNWSSNASNCIVEIPQDINMSLASGTLTLKAGSKCYLKTDTTTPSVTIASDLTTTQTTDGTYFAIYDGSTLTTVLTTTYDYSTLPSTYSLPLALVTVSSGAINSIDKIFNGFGFIDGTVFVLPGLTVLAADGRNTDGTLKSVLITTESVTTITPGTSSSGYTIALSADKSLNGYFGRENDQETYPGSGYLCWYKPSENKIYNSGTGQGTETSRVCATFVYFNPTTNEFSPKTVLRADNYDVEFIAHQAMPSNKYTTLTLGATGSNYTAPADGYFTLNKGGVDGEYVLMTNNTTNLNISCLYPASLNARLFIPVSKGDVIQISYTASGTTNWLRFVYANGSK